MNREVHVQFWESAGLRCFAPLAHLHAYDSVSDARTSVGLYLDLYNRRRPHASLDGMTPDQAYYGAHSLPPVRLAA
jgi:putative transposase